MWPYWVGVVLVPALVARSRRRAPLYLFIAAVLCGLAVLGKGIAGLALPVIIFAVHVLVSGRWRRLIERDLALALPVALLAVAVVAIPWHHAMYVRHGQAWLSELFGDNHWRRLMIGRHGDRGTFEYFVRELGYGVWPLVALVPAALAGGIWGAPLDPGRRVLLRFGAIWFVTAYALVSLSMTKFHHYILPALPGLGILIGLLLDQLLEIRRARAVALVALIGLPLLALVTWDLVATRDGAERFLWLFSYDYIHNPAGRPWPDALDFRPALLVLAGACALTVAALAWPRIRRAGRRGSLPGGAGLEHVPHQPLHAPGGAVLVAEASGGPLLPRPTRAGRTADRLLPVLAGRDLLHRQRDLLRPRT